MDSFDYISIAIGAYLLIAGLASIFTGKVFTMGSSVSKYTEESLKKFSRPLGLANVLCGVGMVLFHVLNDNLTIGTFTCPIGLAVLLVAIVISTIILLATRKMLVKK